MSFPYLDEKTFIEFPPLTENGIVAIGGNLSPGVLLSAYLQGIFPWYNDDEPITWWSPNPRFVILPQNFHIPKRLKRFLNKNDSLPAENKEKFVFKQNTNFSDVIKNCGSIKRKDQNGTWITQEMIDAYCQLHELGYAHSFETWQEDNLVGGFYGVLIGSVFFGESMFSFVPEASKAAFAIFGQNFFKQGGKLIDSQVYTDHIARFGGKNISRDSFLRYEQEYLKLPLQQNR